MSQTGYDSRTVTVAAIQDKRLIKPVGSGVIQITPTIPAAIAQTHANTLPSPVAAYYTKTSSTVLVLHLPDVPGFTTGSKMGIFWTGTDGNSYFCLDCTITSVVSSVVTITAPTLNAAQLAAGMLYFNGAATTGASDVTGKVITPGTTTVTFSVATLATTDEPNNPDLSDYSILNTSAKQILFTCSQTGAVEFFIGADVELAHNYYQSAEFYAWIEGATAPWTGTVDKIRFYNSSLVAQTMSIGILMA